MEPTEEARRIIENVLSRRTLMAAAGGAVASFGLLGLAGCGGHGSNHSSSNGATVSGASGKVSFVLPAGVSGASLVAATGWGSVKGLTKPVTVPYMKGNVTLTFVFDSTNGKVVMAGMVDATASSHVVDATNVAATLIFLKMGGVQTPFAIRPALWGLVLADPATATLASTVQSRLAANPYAIDDQDAALLSAIQSAVSGLSSTTLAGLSLGDTKAKPKLKSRAGGSGASPVDPPIPALNIDLGTETEDETRVILPFDDILARFNHQPREAVVYLYDAAQTDAAGTATVFDVVKLLEGPTALPPQIPPAEPSDQKFVVNLAHPTDLGRHVLEIRLTPVFDSSVDDFLSGVGTSSVYGAFADTWRSDLIPMYQRVAVQVAMFAFLEALGRGGVQFSQEVLAATMPKVAAIGGGVAAAITQAGQGKDLIGSANAIITAVITDAASTTGLLSILDELYGIRAGEINASLLRSTYRLSNWIDTLGAPGSDYTRRCTHRAFDRTFDTRTFNSVYLDSYTLTKIAYTIVPSTSAYSIGGGPVALSLHDTANESANSSLQNFRKYRWKLAGQGNGTLNDGAGNAGRDITTTALNVAFVPGTTTEGDQTITTSVINLESSNAVTTATATLTLSSSLFQLIPNAPTVDISSQKTFLLQHNDGSDFAGGTTFKWTVTGTGTVGGASTTTTTTPTVVYSSPGVPETATITVEVFANGQSQGKVATDITVSTPSRITPFNPYVRHNGTQTFTVAPLTGGYPSGSTFTWTLTGGGSIGGSGTVKTTTPSITFTAPGADASPVLTVTVADSAGKTIAKTSTNISVTNSQIIIPTVQWFNTGTYSGAEAGYTYEEIQGLVVFQAIPGATKYEMHVDDPSLDHPSDPLTAAQYAAGAPVWDPTTPLYQNPDPSIYPVPYGGRHVDYPVEYNVFYNAAGGIAWPIEGGQYGDVSAKFPASFANYFQTQKDAAAARTYRVVVSF